MADFSICDISRLAKYGVHDKPVSTYTFKLWCLQFAAIGSLFNLVHVPGYTTNRTVPTDRRVCVVGRVREVVVMSAYDV